MIVKMPGREPQILNKKIMKTITTICILSFAVLTLSAQESLRPRFKVTSFGSSMGFTGTFVSNTATDYKGLAGNVEDPDLFVDISKWDESKYNYGAGGNGDLQFYLGLTPYDKKKGAYRNNRELRLNFGFSFGARRTFSYFNNTTYTVDTYTSGSGSTVYADSSYFTRMMYAESFYGIGLGAAYIFKTNPERRFHFHTGAGFEYSIALRSFVNVVKYTENELYYYTAGNQPAFEEPDYSWTDFMNDNSDGNTKLSTTNMKGNIMFFRPYIPLGINFRITNREQSFFNDVYLFSEIKPGIEIQLVGNEKTYINPHIGAAMIGFTYTW